MITCRTSSPFAASAHCCRCCCSTGCCPTVERNQRWKPRRQRRPFPTLESSTRTMWHERRCTMGQIRRRKHNTTQTRLTHRASFLLPTLPLLPSLLFLSLRPARLAFVATLAIAITPLFAILNESTRNCIDREFDERCMRKPRCKVMNGPRALPMGLRSVRFGLICSTAALSGGDREVSDMLGLQILPYDLPRGRHGQCVDELHFTGILVRG